MAEVEKDKLGVTRLATGINGLDDLLYGGIPEGSQMLLLGETGSGKTLLSFEILYNNAKKGIPCTFIAVDQETRDILKNVKNAFPQFNEVKEYIDKGTINMYEKGMDNEFKNLENVMVFISEVIQAININQSKMLAIDSLSLMRALLQDDRMFTRVINYITENLHNLGVTSIINIETPSSTLDIPPGLYDESMFDGIIKLSNPNKSGKSYISVVKLRYSKYKSNPMAFEITPEGISVAK